MIAVNQLSKSFHKIQAVRGISFSIRSGEIVGFLGPNGAGKTTLMRLLTGYFPPSGGSISINGNKDVHLKPGLRRHIGYLAENNPLYTNRVTKDYLNFMAQLKGIHRRLRKEEIDRVVALCGIEAVYNRMIGQLSKGFQQRVGLAQALIGDPAILILDEPTNGLDPAQIIAMRRLINELGKKRTVLLSTHILSEVQMTCGRIFILNKGELIASGSPEELEKMTKGFRELMVSVQGEHRDLNFLRQISGVLHIIPEQWDSNESRFRVICEKGVDVRPEISRKIMDRGLDLLSLALKEATLEETFIKLVKEDFRVN